MSTSTGCMLGWYDGNGYSGTNGLQAMETLLGTRFSIVRIYHSPTDWGTVSNQVATAVNDGRLVMASHKPPKVANAWLKTANGDYDTQITALVNSYKALAPAEVIVIYYHEPYGNSSSGHQTPSMGKPSDFAAAFRRFSKAFSDAGADNVKIGYCEVDSRATATTDVCYPGDDVIDVLCHDVYNWGTYDGHTWKDPSTLFPPFVALAKAAGKPVIFGEVGCHPAEGAHTRTQWLTDLAAYLKTGDAAAYIIGFCYYHVDAHDPSNPHYWRFAQGSTADGVSTFTTRFSQDPYFLTQPIAVSLRKAAPPAQVPPSTIKKGGGIPSNIGFGTATVTMTAGPITITSAGAIPAPGDYISPEESAGLDFGSPVVSFSSPEPGLEGDFFFEPPTVDDVPPVPADWLPIPALPGGRPERRLFAHFKSRARGRTVILLKNGTAFVTDYPVQQVPGWQGVGDPFTESGLAGYSYTEIARVFLGGHVDIVNSAEADLLTAAGFGAGLTPIPDPSPRTLRWGALAGGTWADFATNYSTWGA